jgi:hypothetical protein
VGSPLIDEGVAALRGGDTAAARRAFELVLTETESGEALEGLAEALYVEREFSAMGDYQLRRDEQVLPMYELTTQLATLAPPPLELQQLLGAVHGDRDAMNDFARVNAGVLSPAVFFGEDNVGRIMARAAGAADTG